MSTTPLRRTQGGIPRFLPEAAAPAHILTQSQAEAVYSAMCALSAVGTRHGAEFHIGDWVYVRQLQLSGAVCIENRDVGANERYADKDEFATAYGLQTEGQQRRAERRERDEPYLIYGVEETRTGCRA